MSARDFGEKGLSPGLEPGPGCLTPARGKIRISARIFPAGSDGTVLVEECGVGQKHKMNMSQEQSQAHYRGTGRDG